MTIHLFTDCKRALSTRISIYTNLEARTLVSYQLDNKLISYKNSILSIWVSELFIFSHCFTKTVNQGHASGVQILP